METLKNLLPLIRERIGLLDQEEQLALLLCLEGAALLLIAVLRIWLRRSAERVSQDEPTQDSVVQPAFEEESTTTLVSGLGKTRQQFFSRLSSMFGSKRGLGSQEYAALEELLISSDLGVKTTGKLLASLREEVQESEISFDELKSSLKRNINQILHCETPPEIVPQKRNGQPLIVVVVGVNGVGKTTSIGKLAFQFRVQGAKVMVAACDTFRAAAVEQLSVWADRSGVEVVTGDEGSKPSTVAYQAVHRAKNEDVDVLIVDTAGRLHTRVNLMNELENVIKIIEREQPGSPQEVILVVDASTGQNALQQAIDFNARAGLTGIVVTKLDGTPKGGIVVAIKNELDVPIRYVGVGESIADLKLFSAEEFTAALFADEPSDASLPAEEVREPESSSSGEKPKQVRRRRKQQSV